LGLVGWILGLLSMFRSNEHSEGSDAFDRLFSYLVAHIGLHGTQYLIVLLVSLAGVTAYWFKRHNQRLYGLVEIVFALISATSLASGLTPGQAMISRWAALVGCAYILARGVNNYSDGKQLKARDVDVRP
jgi:hypothetical protein